MNENPNKPHDHHYIPQGYMRGFAEVKNVLYVKDKSSGRIRQSSPKGIGYLENFYTVDTVDEKNSSEIEEALGTIESTCLPIMRKLSKGEALSKSERADLAIYIAIQNGRTPHAKARMDEVTTILITNELKQKMADAVNDPNLFSKLMDDFRMADPGKDIPTREKVIEWVLKPGPLAKISIDRGTYVKQFFSNAALVADELLRRRWQVFHAPSGSNFITSDNPIGLYIERKLERHETLAIMLPGAVRYFPLAAQTSLFIPEEQYIETIRHTSISTNEVRRINKIIHGQARRYVISGNETLIKSFS